MQRYLRSNIKEMIRCLLFGHKKIPKYVPIIGNTPHVIQHCDICKSILGVYVLIKERYRYFESTKRFY